MKRLGISFFFDGQGILDDYMVVLLKGLRAEVSHLLFISNGPLTDESSAKLKGLVDEIIIRENTGFDVWAYRAALMHVGLDHLGQYDEVLLLNHTFYGPIFPFREMFNAMARRKCDFWGITAHKEMTPNPFTGQGVLPMHINSHFIAVRKPMLVSEDFKTYWRDMPMINSYTESILLHESRFTKHFQDLGYAVDLYIKPEDYGSDYPAFIDVDETLLNRCPILKRRLFFHEPDFLDANAVDLPRALRIIAERSDYDPELIWKNIVRENVFRNIATNAALVRVLPDVPLAKAPANKGTKAPRRKKMKIAVCCHVYYADMTEELLERADHVKDGYDFIATTDTEAKKRKILSIAKKHPRINKAIVRIVPTNRGRDMAALFITCRDLFLSDEYDLVCRLHTKKSPQVFAARGNIFKRHMFDNLLNSDGYVDNVIDMFAKQPSIGLAVPPIVHISYPTLGHSWFANKPFAEAIAKILEIKVPFDPATPIGAYGTMFWFRPAALRKLFANGWAYTDFNEEPHHVDGGMAHVIERLIAYAVHDAGFITMQILAPHQAEQNYAFLEYKLQRLMSRTPNGDFRWAEHMLSRWQAAGYPVEVPQTPPPQIIEVPVEVPVKVPVEVRVEVPVIMTPDPPEPRLPTLGESMQELVMSGKRSVAHRFPSITKKVRPVYRWVRGKKNDGNQSA